MPKAEFYIVHIQKAKGVTYSQIEAKMNLANDWYRLDDENTWILYSTSDYSKWYERLKELVKDDGRVFICKLDVSNRQGWMNKKFWKWLRREKDD